MSDHIAETVKAEVEAALAAGFHDEAVAKMRPYVSNAPIAPSLLAADDPGREP